MPKQVKRFNEYIVENPTQKVTLEYYSTSPASAFLRYVIDAKNASLHCTNSFKTGRGANGYSKEAINSMQVINAGLLVSIMGNLETYQKYLFAYMFEYSVYLKNPKLEKFLKDMKVNVDISRFSSFRDNPAAVGLIIADNMKSWHSVEAVNNYFRTFDICDANGNQPDFYSNDVVEDIETLWQMRHSIAHTASTITIPDSQKIKTLSSYGGKVIALQHQFINEVARKLHPIIKKATETERDCFINNLRMDINPEIRGKIDKLFEVHSSIPGWFV